MNEDQRCNAQTGPPEQDNVDAISFDDPDHIAVGLAENATDIDIVDWSSDGSFPASDPPPWNPGIA